jgi:hypothetical protein
VLDLDPSMQDNFQKKWQPKSIAYPPVSWAVKSSIRALAIWQGENVDNDSG